MFRYFALVWNPAHTRVSATAQMIQERLFEISQGWSSSFSGLGIAVFHADAKLGAMEAYELPGGSGVVLGKVFDKRSDAASVARSVVFDDAEAARLVESDGKRFSDNYWGQFVAFMSDERERRVLVHRDAVGALPCWSTHYEGVHVFFSWDEDWLRLNLGSYSLNEQYLQAYVCFSIMVSTHETATNEAQELRPGETWVIRRDGTLAKRFFGTLTDRAREPVEDIDIAVRRTRETFQTCVSAWAACHPRVLQLLSGGLDSSIVSHTLRDAPSRPDVTCLNYFNPDSPGGDERDFARLAAESAGHRLVVHEDRPEEVDLRCVERTPASCVPWYLQYDATHSHIELAYAREYNADGIWYGVMGDQVGYQGPVENTVAACLESDGFAWPIWRTSAWRAASDISRTERRSRWALLRNARRENKTRIPWSPGFCTNQMKTVPAELIARMRESSYLDPQWIDSAENIPWAKLEHLRMMALPMRFYNPLAPDDAPHRLLPIASLPLLELFASFPMHVLTAGGIDRAMPRRAFAGIVPDRIIRRRIKGVVSEYFQRLFAANSDYICERLLDGVLVRLGLLNRDAIEAARRNPMDHAARESAEIVVYHLAVEEFASRLYGRSRRIAA